ncbi:MAG: hypothetical protein JWP27_2998 [Flaviaesturariibacter sp.]|nr:hypothetical protein [Flaviaesturariibacter sp.]
MSTGADTIMEAPPAITAAPVCPSCHAPFAGAFCSVCGEKQRSAHDLTLGHFIEESVEGFTHFDNKFIRSFKTLFTRPGLMTTHFEEGVRVPYMKPVQLFFVSNLLFFVLSGGMNVFAISLKNYTGYTKIAALLQQRFTKEQLATVQVAFNEKVLAQSKAFIFLFIPFIALACALLFYRKRKPFTLHLVFAAHYFTFVLLEFTLFYLLVETPSNLFFHFSEDVFEIIAVATNLSALSVYFILAARRYYKAKWIWSIIAGLLIGALFMQLLIGYRLFLFYKIFYSLH